MAGKKKPTGGKENKDASDKQESGGSSSPPSKAQLKQLLKNEAEAAKIKILAQLNCDLMNQRSINGGDLANINQEIKRNYGINNEESTYPVVEVELLTKIPSKSKKSKK